MILQDVQPDLDESQTSIVLRYRPPLCCRSARFVLDSNRARFPISLLDQASEAEINEAIGEINRMLTMTSSFRWQLWPSILLLIVAAITAVSIGFMLFNDASIDDLMPWLTYDNIITIGVVIVVAIIILLLYLTCIVQLKDAQKIQGIGQVLWYLNNRFVGRLYWQLSADSNRRPMIIIREPSAAYIISPDPVLNSSADYVPVMPSSDNESHQVAVRMTSSGCRQQ